MHFIEKMNRLNNRQRRKNNMGAERMMHPDIMNFEA